MLEIGAESSIVGFCGNFALYEKTMLNG